MLVRTEDDICPKCGGHLCWGESTGKTGARVEALCVNHPRRTRLHGSQVRACNFEAIAERTANGKVIYEYIPITIDQLSFLWDE